MSALTARTVLSVLTRAELIDLGRKLDLGVPASAVKDEQVDALVAANAPLERVLEELSRDDLKAVCRAHELPDGGRDRASIIARILDAAGIAPNVARPSDVAEPHASGPPREGDVVHVRLRQWLVEAVTPPPGARQMTRVDLVCIDDDAQGRELSVLWELELGARVIQPRAHGLGEASRLDPPRHFAAYLHALRWSCVTATDARLFQAPFRAGIQIKDYQLTPLKKALSLPRVNLFIADDVGLGKTIEAGLVLQELLLRQRVDWALVVCPASVTLQWKAEMEKRFGLRFEVYDRRFVARRRQERGFGVNPWGTHSRFIISYQTLRRPEYRDPLLAHLGSRLRKSLLVLDEAHTAAPATASRYAVDSRVTRTIRDLAPRFENRLFLSATPHNGHSNSFSSLLEILDPQRFTRGVPVTSTRQLEPVMVRRLKSDLRELGESFPDRKVLAVELVHERGAWVERGPDGEVALGEGDDADVRLAQLLARYTELAAPPKGRGRLVFVNLQKRLLSSVEAFHRTLRLHADNVGKGGAPAVQLTLDDEDADDDAIDEHEGATAAALSRDIVPQADARALLHELVELAARRRAVPDAKVRSLIAWIRRHLCAGVNVDGHPPRGAEKRWSDRRVIVFTEYGDTKRWLEQILRGAVQGTDAADERILGFHGGMSDEGREEVQRAFNADPAEHPVRILVATDAAREGINLQAHCADLFHFDLPWNPARIEQRNGRIDRALQPAAEVRCHYFVYPQRPEDLVLAKVVAKVERIQRELGSLGAVILDRVEEALEAGIDARTEGRLDAAEQVPGREVVQEELEAERASVQKLQVERDEAARILDRSKAVMEFDAELLRDALDVGCELAGAPALARTEVAIGGRKVPAFRVPQLPDSWASTLDSLRPARRRDEPFWEWRKRAPLPVVFEPPGQLTSDALQLHLAHPFVQRLLSRFTSQGFSAHDLSRVTVVRTQDHVARVIVFGRLTLFGGGAVRLHDEVLAVAAPWLEAGGKGHLVPLGDDGERRALDRLEATLRESPELDVPGKVQRRLLDAAPGDFAALWPHVEAEGESKLRDARTALTRRGEEEAAALRRILESQKKAIEKTLGRNRQLDLQFGESEREQREQFEQDAKHMEQRLASIDREIAREPDAIRESYVAVRSRLVPVGIVYVWPASR